ncbi:condensation domain-containing protein [Virgisporangium aurantiacum]|uniref:Carrier domain-containing protein n=1 Tax=Virgisporangium aurantiacum TaxID=175570 RepID=A0A8J3ZDX2_9ACTN|nr:condensation domain-containing protein [Virgisporangium aurantiacum]GIJ62222.1 hypothetical protein Vau01_097380 [Virgisporangium aurantiacum]
MTDDRGVTSGPVPASGDVSIVGGLPNVTAVGAAAEWDGAAVPIEQIWLAALGDLAESHPGLSGTGFLDLGGDSLRAARFSAALYRDTGTRVPVRWLVADNASLDEVRARLRAEIPRAAPSTRPPDRLPLTPAQHRLLLLHRMHGGLPEYNVVSAVTVRGRVGPDRLEDALSRAVRRHPALRTRIRVDADEPWQEVLADAPVRPRVVAVDRHTSFDGQVRREISRLQRMPFDLDRAPLHTLSVLSDPASDTTALVFAADHLIADQHSVELLWAELLGRPRTDRPVDEYHAAVERRIRAHVDARPEDLAYWRGHVASPQPLRLPFGGTPPRTPTFRGVTAVRHLDEATWSALATVCRQHGLRRSPVLLAALAAVLCSWSGDGSVVVGVPVDGRRSLADTDVVGFFVDTLPLTVAVDGDRRLGDLAAGCHDALVAAMRHGAVDFETVVRQAGPAGRNGRNPVFQAWFNDLSGAEQPLPAECGDVERVRVPDPPALFDVGLYVYAGRGGGIDLSTSCAADLFGRDVAGHLAAAVAHVVAAFVGRPTAAIADALPTGRLPTLVAPRAVDVADLVERFLAVARAEPERPALTGAGGVTTYGELSRRVTALADRLRASVDAGRPVGTVARRAPALAVAILAGWSVGRPPVLLDARLPGGLRSAVLRAVGADHELDLRAPEPVLSRLAAAGPRPDPAPAGPIAHVLTTSGTTGEPRSVAVPGRSVAAALVEQAEHLGVGRDDRFVALAGPGHDPILRELVMPLVLGATVAVPDDATVADPRRLLAFIRERRVTVLQLTPARAALLTAAADGQGLPHVRLVVTAGGELTGDLAARLGTLCPNARIGNGYGLTEVPQLSGLHLRSPADRGGVPVGTGCGARRLVVLRGSRPAAVGQLGEIGVLEPYPPVLVTGERLRSVTPDGSPVPAVLTGDLGRLRPDGLVEWAGRADRQFDIDSHRIEPAAVERLLADDPAISAAVVGRSPAGALVAYVTVADDALRDGDAERYRAVPARLADRLPAWSVPETLHVVPHLVLDHNGKPDVAATAALAEPAPTTGAAAGAIERTIERTIEDILARHLPTGAALPHDVNFFELGLDSAAMIRVHRELHRVGFPELELVELFWAPTVADLAGRLRAGAQPAAPTRGRRGPAIRRRAETEEGRR